MNSKTFQTGLWKLSASMGPHIIAYNPTPEWIIQWRYPQACVPEPLALLVGKATVTYNIHMYNVSCTNCVITNCIRGIDNGTKVIVLYQPAFVMLPVNISGDWYQEEGLQLWRETYRALARTKRFVALLIIGITALISMIAAAATAAVALSQSVQTANYVNDLTKNVSQALGTQEDIDRKIEKKLNALYDTVQSLGNEIQSMKLKNSLKCPAAFNWICVTAKNYNESQYNWKKITKHLFGIWHHENMSLDLRQLHNEIVAIKKAPPLDTDLAAQASDFVKNLINHFPSVSDFQNVLITIVVLFALVVMILCLGPCVVKLIIKNILSLKAAKHGAALQLKAENDPLPV